MPPTALLLGALGAPEPSSTAGNVPCPRGQMGTKAGPGEHLWHLSCVLYGRRRPVRPGLGPHDLGRCTKQTAPVNLELASRGMMSGRPHQLPVKAGGNTNIWAWSLNRGPGAAMATCRELGRRAATQSLGLWRPEVRNEGVSRASSLRGSAGEQPPASPSFRGIQSPSACGRVPPASAPPSLCAYP